MTLCVLTGDIVGSTTLTTDQMKRINASLSRAKRAIAETGAVLETFRGDGWQMSLDPKASGLRYALIVRATLRAEDEAFATRIALAEGNVEFEPEVTNTGVHVRSGRALDAMPKGTFMSHAAGGYRQTATLLADHISRGWTQAQARAIGPFLLPGAKVTQKEVAERLGITRQAVGQALEAAGYHPLKRGLDAMEEQAR